METKKKVFLKTRLSNFVNFLFNGNFDGASNEITSAFLRVCGNLVYGTPEHLRKRTGIDFAEDIYSAPSQRYLDKKEFNKNNIEYLKKRFEQNYFILHFNQKSMRSLMLICLVLAVIPAFGPKALKETFGVGKDGTSWVKNKYAQIKSDSAKEKVFEEYLTKLENEKDQAKLVTYSLSFATIFETCSNSINEEEFNICIDKRNAELQSASKNPALSKFKIVNILKTEIDKFTFEEGKDKLFSKSVDFQIQSIKAIPSDFSKLDKQVKIDTYNSILNNIQRLASMNISQSQYDELSKINSTLTLEVEELKTNKKAIVEKFNGQLKTFNNKIDSFSRTESKSIVERANLINDIISTLEQLPDDSTEKAKYLPAFKEQLSLARQDYENLAEQEKTTIWNIK